MHLYRLGELNLVLPNRYFPYSCSHNESLLYCLFVPYYSMVVCLAAN